MFSEVTVDQVFQIVGVIGTVSFFFVAFSDMIVHSLDIIVQRFIAVSPSPAAQKAVYVWNAMKAIYEEFRIFLDKMSAYSRPRKKE